MSNLTQFSSGGIKSIQRGTITISGTALTATATITAVDTAKSELRHLGVSSNPPASTIDHEYALRLSLTNSTTITATRAAAPNSTSAIVSWELTEWM